MILRRYILVLMLFPAGFSLHSEKSLTAHVDSIYHSLDERLKANKLVWLNSTEDQHDLLIDQFGIGGIYYSSYRNIDPFDHGVVRALQLDKSLNPTQNHKLPGIASLSAIRNESLFMDYCNFRPSPFSPPW